MKRLGDFTLVRRRMRRFAEASEQPLPDVDRLHAAEGLLRRLAATPEGRGFALRGALLRRTWGGAEPGPVRVVELAFDGTAEDVWAALQSAAMAPVPDAVRFDPHVLTVDPLPRPGNRPAVYARVAARFAEADAVEIEVDLGPTGATDTVAFPAVLGPTDALRRQTPAAAFAERLQALVDPARVHFAPADLLEAWHIATVAQPSPGAVALAVADAFTHRGVSAGRLRRLLGDRFGESKSSLKSWRRHERDLGQPLPEVAEAVAAVRALVLASGVDEDETRLGQTTIPPVTDFR